MILDIFKIGIYNKELSVDTKKLTDYCLQYSYNVISRTVSNNGGYQSPDIPLNDTSLSPLFSEILHEANIYANSILLKEQQLDNAWLNINSYKDNNISHAHPGCTLSGVFYVNTPTDCGNIIFERPNMVEFENTLNGLKSFNEYNSAQWTLPAKENFLYIFPSFLRHRVESNMNENLKRISISFNTQNI